MESNAKNWNIEDNCIIGVTMTTNDLKVMYKNVQQAFNAYDHPIAKAIELELMHTMIRDFKHELNAILQAEHNKIPSEGVDKTNWTELVKWAYDNLELAKSNNVARIN